ncbi:MFS transporter [Catenovulum sp. 2E275]|uniref:MFS transporter n=1 Tax=Catenovulum sp. 2E275 TaxID=2980497 RepID=UPI0021D15654|nr:MFS transporter [Catenovulum sp. 2E275]MCU4676460.1 MFS transporter [Catenovulum sp. 2E275]
MAIHSSNQNRHSQVTRIEKLGYGAGDMAINVAYSSMMLLITFFYTDVYGLAPQDMGLMFVVVRVLDSLITPVIGYICDNVTSRWGRYRHYLLFLSVPFGLSIFLTFTTPDLDYQSKLIWAYASYAFVTIMFTAVTIPYISLLNVLTVDPKERLSASGYRLFMAKLAAFSVTVFVPILSTAGIWQGDLQLGYQMAMGLMSVMAVILFVFCFSQVKERVRYPNVTLTFSQQMMHLVKNDQLLILCLSFFLSSIGFMIRGAMAMYYAGYFLGGSTEIQSAFLAVNVSASLLAMVASTWLTKRLCKIKLFYSSQMLAGALSILMFFCVSDHQVALAFVFFFLISFIVDLHAPVFWSAIADAVDYGQYKHGVRVPGMTFCLVSFCQKIAIGLAGAIVGTLLVVLDYKPGEEATEYAMYGIAFAFTIIPGILHLLVGLVMQKYTLKGAQVSRLSQKLDALKTAGYPTK